MTRFLRNLSLDTTSFLAGIFLVAVLVYLFLKYRKRIQTFLTNTYGAIIDFRESLSVTSDSDYVQVLYKYIQGLHIWSDYFPLDSILVPAKCIAPPPYHFPGKESLDTSLIQQVIGYDPLLPQLNTAFAGPTFPLVDAVQNGTNLCLLGYPGSGKTVAIAECIAALVKPADAEDLPDPIIPFYLKAHHLLSQFPGQDLVGIILKALQLNKAFLTIPNFPKYLTNAINSGQCVLFIDDMDGLSLPELNRLANFIGSLGKEIPTLQVVATASPSCLGQLTKAPLEFISIAPWGSEEQYSYLDKLGKLWSSVQSDEAETGPGKSAVLNSMLVVSSQDLTPLEFSLKAMAAFGGDITGSETLHALEAYLNRLGGITEEDRIGLELMAVFCLDANQSAFTRKEVATWFSSVYRKKNTNPAAVRVASFQPAIQAAVDLHILQTVPGNKYYFNLPTIAGYLAAKGAATAHRKIILNILEQPDWGMLYECMRHLPAFNDIKPFLKPFLNDKSLLKHKLLRSSHWLVYCQQNSPEETALFKRITQEIHTNNYYLIKIRFVCALAKSKNPQVIAILQHLLKSKELETRRAAAVGLGLLQDLTAVPFLIQQLNDYHPSSTAACYALGRIGSPRSLEAIAEALLHGSELLRRAAAESLAQNRSEGHPALREGSTREDLLVRYAVVHGLSMIKESWALEILDTMRIDEKEWVVRDLAQQAYEIMETLSPYLPPNTPRAHEAPWLAEFAAQQEIPPVTPENALEVLLKALELGSYEQKQNALAHISRSGTDELVPAMLELANHEAFELTHQALLSIWFCAVQRYKLF